MHKKKLNIIVAVDNMGGFAKEGQIPWIKESFAKADLANFKETTKGHICVMGRNTYDDMFKIREESWKKWLSSETKQNDFEILPGRESIVLSRSSTLEFIGATKFSSLRKVMEHYNSDLRKIFIIGGEKLYIQALGWNVESIFVTLVDKFYGCDKFFPISSLLKKYEIVRGKKNKDYPELFFVEYKPRIIIRK